MPLLQGGQLHGEPLPSAKAGAQNVVCHRSAIPRILSDLLRGVVAEGNDASRQCTSSIMHSNYPIV